MTIDCSFNWPEIRRIAGPCMRPGGPVLTERALEICSLPPGERLPDAWGCRQGQEGKKTDLAGISYFLLVARKSGASFQSVEKKEDGTLWTT